MIKNLFVGVFLGLNLSSLVDKKQSLV